MIDVESKFIVSNLQCVLHRESFLVSSFANHVTIKLARFVAPIFLSAVLFSSVKLYYITVATSRLYTISVAKSRLISLFILVSLICLLPLDR